MFLNQLKSYLAFFLKWRILGFVRSALLLFFGRITNTAGWENRVLVVNLHALGDVTAMTSILQRYKIDFPEKNVYCLFPKDVGVTEKLFEEFADYILFVDLKKFGSDLSYELNFINGLRAIGFQTVVNQGYGLFELPGKIIAVNLGAKEVIGYEGLITEYENADWVMRRRIAFIKHSLFPRYSTIVPIIDRDFRKRGRVATFPLLYAAIYGGFLGHEPKILPTKIGIDNNAEKSARDMLSRKNIALGTYAVFVIGGRTPVRWWPTERFAEVAKEVYRSGAKVVIIGTKAEQEAITRFKELSDVPVADFSGELSVAELVSVIHHSLFVLTNDTAPVHLAIALKKPSVCIMGLGIFGVSDHYGYPQVNRWVYEKDDCFFDYWRCIERAKPGEAAPCIMAVSTEKVTREVRELITFLKEGNLDGFVGDKDFKAEF